MLSKYSVKKPYTVIVGIILVIVLGIISFQKMTTDLLPSMDLPYVIVYTTYVGATPEQVESEVVRPMESSFATLTDVKKITSSSRDSVGLVVMQFNDGANMDTALIEISSKLDQLRGAWDDGIGAPVTMKLNPDLLPVAILSVTRDDMDILALSDYVEDELVPAFESLNGVASASASGVIDQRIDVTIEQSRIDVLNSAILRDVDAELADVEQQLNDAQAQLSDGKRMLARAKSQAYKQIDDAIDAIDQGATQIDPAIEQLTQQRAELVAQRDQLAQSIAALEQLVNMDDSQKAQLRQMAQGLALMKQQLAALEEQLAAAEAAQAAGLTDAQRADLQAQRDELAAQLASQQQYLNDLALLDADALRSQIAALQGDISSDESALADAQKAMTQLESRRDETQRQIEALIRRIADAGGEVTAAPTATQTADNTAAPRATQAANSTATPEATQAADNTATPEATQAADNTATPEATQAADNTATPEATQAADNTAEPENTQAAENTTAPEATQGSESTAAPEATEAADSTAAPENTQAADNTAVPEDSQDSGRTAPPEAAGDSDAPKASDASNSDAPAADGAVADSAASAGGDDAIEASANASEAGALAISAPEMEEVPSDGGPGASGPMNGDDAPRPSADAAEAPIPEDAAATTRPAASDAPSTRPDASDAPSGFAALRLGGALAEESSVEELRRQLSAAQESLARLAAEIEARSGEIADLNQALAQNRELLESRLSALATLTENNEDVQSRMDEAQRLIDGLNERIAALDQELAALDGQQDASGAAIEALRQSIAQLNEQIAAVESSEAYQALSMLEDPDSLNAQYAQAQEGLAQLDAGIAAIDDTLDKLKRGVIPGGYIEGIDEDTNLADARAQLLAARGQADSAFAQAASQISEGEAELAKARKEFNEKRDEALENAGLDGVITIQTVSGLIGAQNFAMPAGYVYDADNEQVLVRVGEKFDTLDGLRRMKLFNLGLDSVDEVRLLDVASVELTDNRDEVFTKLNGSDGILLSLDKQSTYSTAEVADTVLARAKELMAADPNLHIVDLMNQGEYINIIVDSVLNNLISGGGLAILILLLFLMDFRPTITVAFSIPISVVIAFVCMYFTGITLNVLSLSGLSLGIGMLVDNSIVAIENIYRLHDEEGYPLLRACVEGVRSVSGALFSSTLTTICVFLPIVFVQGMARDLFSDMGLTIAFSLLASLFVAMTVVPAMCSFLMRHSKPHKHLIFGAIQRFYGMLLRGALRFKPLVLLAALALLAFSAMQVPKMGISFMPEVNSRQMSADLAFDPEMTEQQRQDQAIAIMNDMMAVEGVDTVGLMGGSGGMLAGLSGGSGMSYYIMVDESLGRKNADIAREMQAIGEKYGADLSVSASTMDISMLTGSGISVEITGDDLDTLQAMAVDIAELARQTEGVTDVDDGLEDAVPEYRIIVDKEKAIDEGLTTAQVFQFVAQKVAGRIEITQVTLNGKELSIYLQDGANLELRPEDLEDLEIEVDGEEENKLVRVGDVADISLTTSLNTINRASQRRMVSVSFGIAEGYSANLVSDAFEEKLKGYDVPAGYSAALAGENETVMGIMEDLVWMVLVAILLIFLIMVAQFQSFKSPIIVMFTIPLAFTGGLLALLLTGMDLSIVSMLGFLVLSGVVVNNGIVFIDNVNQLRIAGMEKREALLETGRTRLRPILMTALTTILGMSTMALGHGTGAEMMQPMAVVSIGGLTYATLMTLFIVPVLYDLLNGKTMKAREIQMIKEAAGLTGDEVLEGDDRVGDEALPQDSAGTVAAPAPGSEPASEAAPGEGEAVAAKAVNEATPGESGSTPPEAAIEAAPIGAEAVAAGSKPESESVPVGTAPESESVPAEASPLGAEPEREALPASPESAPPALSSDSFLAPAAPAKPRPVRVRMNPRRR